CAICAWRENCQRRYSVSSDIALNCPEYTFDITLKNKTISENSHRVNNKKKDENWKLIPRWSYILRKMDIDLEKIKLKFNYHIFSPFTIKVKTENELNKLIEEYSHRNKKKDNVLNYFYYYILQLKIKTGIEYVDQEMENKDKKNKNIVLSII
ncbi:MAG: hypothetical protein QW303_07815, partial [Nitrososphaerota archaeon]